MSEEQILAAVQEVLLSARISNISGTASEWAKTNPVLGNGEIGFVEGSIPAKFKVGDGTTPWNSLGWGNVNALGQLTEDSSHRTVSDIQIGAWNEKATVFVFNHTGYLHPPTGVPNPQVQIIKDIVAAAHAGLNPVVVATNIRKTGDFAENPVSGFVAFGPSVGDEITGRVGCVAVSQNDAVNGIKSLDYVDITFRADGTALVQWTPAAGDLLTPGAIVNNLTDASTNKALSANMGKTLKAAIDNKKISEYSLIKTSTEAGFASTYRLTKDGAVAGAPINIPLDQVLKSSLIKTVTAANSPYAGAVIGNKYIEFLFQNNNTPQYLPVQDLVDVYTADNVYVQVSASNVISLKYEALKSKLQADLGGVFDSKGAGAKAAEDALAAFQKKSFVIQCTIPGLN